ncbi:MAG: putative DNA binding domain-containing protein [Gracilibacteraceae bacterium]|jgi:ATP-dependent DNA helicase RecG|nr:putative DNA binding domain-containing protein [Gracilibacteraceae bacterium]
MTSEHIQKLLAEGEGLAVEFKECVNELNNSVFETVCSFSNRYGGHLILGVSDGGAPVGVNPKAAPQMKMNFASMLNNPQKTSPSLFLNFEEVEVAGKLLLHAYIPVSSQIQSCSGRIYDRNESGDFDITNSTELIAHLSVRKSNRFTEREVFPYATLDDLRLDLVPRVKRMAVGRVPNHPWKDMTDMELFKSAGLYERDKRTGKEGFNRAAILLFGREEVIQQVAPGYVTDCLLRVKNIDRYDDRLRVETNLIESFDVLMDFIAKHTNDPFFLIDNLNVSVRSHIAKEIVSNILVHREFSGTFPARIIIGKDSLVAENWNRALHHGRIDPDNFEPYPKNPILARFFVNIGYADTLGSGVRNLMKYTKLYSGGEPELIEGDIFKTIIPLGPNVPVSVAELPIEVADNLPTADKLPVKVADNLPIANKLPVKVADNLPVTDKLPVKVADKSVSYRSSKNSPNLPIKLTAGETAFLQSLESYLSEYEWITNAQAREITEKTEGSVKRFLRNLANKGALESRGENKMRQYRRRNYK